MSAWGKEKGGEEEEKEKQEREGNGRHRDAPGRESKGEVFLKHTKNRLIVLN